MNVFDFAMKMETDGKAYYEKLARETSLPGLSGIFARLAADEAKHYEIFAALKSGNQVPSMRATTILEEVKNVFAGLSREKTSLQGAQAELAAYQHAMKLESDSFRLYEDAAAKEQNAGVKALLLQIAGEEHKHFNVLANIFQFVNAPNQFLAWREFSNLDEFHQFGRDVDS